MIDRKMARTHTRQNSLKVIVVDRQSSEISALLPESFAAFLIFLHMMLQGCRVTLAQTVDVHDGHQVVQLVVGGEWHGLPDSTLWHLTIPHQAVHTIAEVENRVRRGRGRGVQEAGKSHVNFLWHISSQIDSLFHYLTVGSVTSCDMIKASQGPRRRGCWDSHLPPKQVSHKNPTEPIEIGQITIWLFQTYRQ